MKKTVRAAALGLALSVFVQGAGAIGFGRLPASATIGQPLDLAIPVRLEPGEAIPSDCIGASVSFADTPQQPGTISLRLDPALPEATERNLRLRTTARVDEPIVTVELTLGCGSKVSRQFTLFADPPLVTAAATAETPPAVAEPAASAPARLDDVPVPSTPAETAAPPRPPRRSASTQPRRPAAARSAAPAPRENGAPARAQGGSRLRLAPLEAGTTVAAARGAPGTPGAASAAPTASTAPATPGAIEAAALSAAAAAQEAASAASAAVAAEAAATARAAQLEEALQRVRADSASAQNAIAALRADLDRVRKERGGSPWLLDALLLALVLALAALAWLWRQRQQDREAGEWMRAGAPTVVPDHGPEFDEQPTEASVSQTPALSAKVLADEEPDDGGPAGRTGPITMPMPVASPASPAEPKREVSVEELIDLEQQAEFFVVLGQDEAAIDLLMGHLRSTSGTSPLPYLKLLEIYKRRGERKPYELLRERFNGRFSAIAPAWDTDWQTGRSLEDYPSVLERLQGLWFAPSRAMEVLQATLMRPAGSERDAPGSQVGFDLPAYRELMFLYAVARDRSETETGGGGVDVPLPLGETDASEPPLMFERLIATTSLEAQPSVRQPLTVDLPIDDAPTTTAAAALLHVPAVDFDPSELPPLDPLPRER